MAEKAKTMSEQLLERYFKEHGLGDFEYEPEVIGTTKHPDYRIRTGESDVFLEVKEFQPPVEISCGRFFDPYYPVRLKINEAQKQLRNLKGSMCGIVLANPYRASRVFLGSRVIYGAMLGNVGLKMPCDSETGELDVSHATQNFLDGGKMIRYREGKPIAPQNTTISAICVLSYLPEGSRRFEIWVAQRERATGEARTVESIEDLTREAVGTEADSSLYRLRLQVYENSYAIVPLTSALGTGPYDERFGVRDGSLTRVFVGPSLFALEGAEIAIGIQQKDPTRLRLRE